MSSGIDPAILDALQAGPVYEVIPLPDAIGGGIILFALGVLGGWLLYDSVRRYLAWRVETR